jgi:hypothetical protein
MDVWFDSGSSWHAVVQAREGVNAVADVCLEGSDQHRGWFQSSLLTSVVSHRAPVAPYRAVITHGFVVDANGRKMSKSLKNGVDPRVVIEGGKNQNQQPPYGTDLLRTWVASSTYVLLSQYPLVIPSPCSIAQWVLSQSWAGGTSPWRTDPFAVADHCVACVIQNSSSPVSLSLF